MHDTDPFIATVFHHSVSAEQLDGARRQLLMLRSLHEEVRATVPTMTPPSTGAWRSTTADRYKERLDDLRMRLFAARDRLSQAEQDIEERIARMQAQLEAQAAARGGAG